MPKLQGSSLPKYRRHRASGQAVVTLDGRDFYLGPHGTKASFFEYDRLIAEWLANGRRRPQAEPPVPGASVVELVAAYLKHALAYYRKDGEPTGEVANIQAALRPLRTLYGRIPLAEFGPKHFDAVRLAMARAGITRQGVNARANRIRRMFKWGVAQGLVPPGVWQALTSVAGLSRGRSDAREAPPVLPVTDQQFEATLPHLPPVVADMARLQRLTGMRPGEVCQLRPGDLDSSGEVWLYRPARHKTEHHGRSRVIALGPKAQALLRPYLDRPAEACCFQPREAEAERRTAAHARRKTPLSCGNKPGSNRKPHPRRPAGERYTTQTYARAIARACERAFEMPEHLRDVPRQPGLAPEKRAELLAEARAWRSRHTWSPNQLRHAAATEVRRRFGLEAAQVALGHATADVTQIYAERDLELAKRVAAEIG